MHIKREFIPDEKPLNLNYIVIDNAKLIKDDQEPLKDIGPVYKENPYECFQHCTEIGDNRCNIVEYNHIEKLCKFYDLPQDDNVTLKFKFSDKELIGESFTTSTIESIKKEGITKEECISLFNSNTDSIFYNYKKDGSYTDCIVGLAAVDNNNSFGINLNSFNNELNFVGTNLKYQIENEDDAGKAGQTKEQKEGGKEGNGIPLLLVAIGIIGVIIITGLIYYGIRMVKKANQYNSANGNSRNTRNQISYKIKNSDPHSSGSKNSTLNSRSQHSQYSYNISSYSLTNKSQHSTVSNIAPQIYDYNDTSTSTYINSAPNSLPNSLQTNNLQDFYNNASLSFGVPNYGNSNYGSSNHSNPNYSNLNYINPSYSKY